MPSRERVVISATACGGDVRCRSNGARSRHPARWSALHRGRSDAHGLRSARRPRPALGTLALTPERRAKHDEHYLQAFGTLSTGITLERATAECGGSPRADPGASAGQLRPDGADRPGRQVPRRDSARRLWVLLGPCSPCWSSPASTWQSPSRPGNRANPRASGPRGAGAVGGASPPVLTRRAWYWPSRGCAGRRARRVARPRAPGHCPGGRASARGGLARSGRPGVLAGGDARQRPAVRHGPRAPRSADRPHGALQRAAAAGPPAGMTGSPRAGGGGGRAGGRPPGRSGLLVRTALYLARVEPSSAAPGW